MFCFQMGLQLLGDIVRILDRAGARDESMVDGSTSFAMWTIISGIAGTYEEALGRTDKLLRGRARRCG
jgi:hypothetical protein